MKIPSYLQTLTILYLEDEDLIRENITKTLSYIFHNVLSVSNVDEALKVYHQEKIDLILSDISMPKKNGLDFVKTVREENKHIPIILLSAHTDTAYLLDATKLKLVDYLIKPINFEELTVALIKAGKESIENREYEIYFNNTLKYNFEKKVLFQNSEPIHLTAKEIQLLEFLYENKEKTVSKEEIQNHVWNDYYSGTESAFKSLLNKLRSKIGKESIKNISGVGYQLYIKVQPVL